MVCSNIDNFDFFDQYDQQVPSKTQYFDQHFKNSNKVCTKTQYFDSARATISRSTPPPWKQEPPESKHTSPRAAGSRIQHPPLETGAAGFKTHLAGGTRLSNTPPPLETGSAGGRRTSPRELSRFKPDILDTETNTFGHQTHIQLARGKLTPSQNIKSHFLD